MKTFDDVIDQIDTLISNDMDVDVINDIMSQVAEQYNLDTKTYGCTATGLEEACFDLGFSDQQISEICESLIHSLKDSV